ncbi:MULTISPECIES: hypothetical protein [Methylomonas]|uniref:Uncharacterized protein n=1 Tax=Methylomonas koyamae TaxID=702114 RepID=A0A291IMG6_9GAMM|nr:MULTISPECIES: hypothetical protein [Methylomonas]ANE56510.1 hypothetical protein AYM39_15890 [Methylomonas sp. DH-1]ATG91473.1 hypothetical protein MKLM6_3282 [Methylomonas koyamae]OAI26864.1 hypothetical protein A1356_10640 [Methylomonas koyamae]WNB74950.1 hypothetical protein RI210_16915 [Methylomonas koyamae]
MNPAIGALLAILAVSALGGWLLCRNKPVEKPVKVMLFVGYFWGLAFSLLILAVLAYLGWQRFGV